MKVLIIDDEEDTRSIASMSLSILGGVDVVEAEGGLEGIAKAEQDRPDVILLDMMMPGMDGSQTLQELLKNPKTADIPVIFLTAKAMTSEIERLTRMGAIAVLTKPFDPTTLAGQVEKILSSRGLHVTPPSGATTQPAAESPPQVAPSAAIPPAAPFPGTQVSSDSPPVQNVALLPPQQGIQIAQSSGLVSSAAGGYFPTTPQSGQGTALNATFPDLSNPALMPQQSPWQALTRPIEPSHAQTPAPNYQNYPNQPQPTYPPQNGSYAMPGATNGQNSQNQTYIDPYGGSTHYNQAQNPQMVQNYAYQQTPPQQMSPQQPNNNGYMLTPQQRQQILQQSITSDYAQLPPRNLNRPLNQNFPQGNPDEPSNFIPNYPRGQQGTLELPHNSSDDKQRLQQQSATGGYDTPGGTIGPNAPLAPYAMPNQQQNNYPAPSQSGQPPPQARFSQPSPQSTPTLPPGYQVRQQQDTAQDPWVTAANENVQTSSAHSQRTPGELARTFSELSNQIQRIDARSSGSQPAIPDHSKAQPPQPQPSQTAPQYTPPAQTAPPAPPKPPTAPELPKPAVKSKSEREREKEKEKEPERERFSHPWGPQHKPNWSGDADPLQNGYVQDNPKRKNDKSSDKKE
ncbi:MAG TPA: response regulator [Oculatellaceae cyanobacterium]